MFGVPGSSFLPSEGLIPISKSIRHIVGYTLATRATSHLSSTSCICFGVFWHRKKISAIQIQYETIDRLLTRNYCVSKAVNQSTVERKIHYCANITLANGQQPSLNQIFHHLGVNFAIDLRSLHNLLINTGKGRTPHLSFMRLNVDAVHRQSP